MHCVNRHMKHGTLALVCTTAALGLAACGPGTTGGTATETKRPATLAELPAPKIIDKAVAATKSVSSLTVDMDGVDEGERMKFHMALDTSGECAGHIGMTEGTVQLIKTGDTAYLKYDDAFWKSQGEDGEAAQALLGDRWMKTEAAGADAEDLTSLCDLDDLLAGFEEVGTTAKKGRPTTVNGIPAITLTEKDGAETYTLYVATEGMPYMLKIVTKGGKEPGTLQFTDFDKPVNAKAPAAGDTVDIDKLGS